MHIKDISNIRFGRLVAIETQGVDKRRTALWLCNCDCGKSCIKSGSDLRTGKVSSCGCYQADLARELGKKNKINLTGKQFGKWTILSEFGRNGQGKILWTCLCECGNTSVNTTDCLRRGKSKSCGCSLIGINNPRWKGGTFMTAGGYIRMYLLKEEKLSDIVVRISSNNKRKLVLQHHYVMAKFLGRPIDTYMESIHHKNGIRSDNRIENLELKVRYHSPGQSIEDRLKDAKDFIEKYEKEYFRLKEFC